MDPRFDEAVTGEVGKAGRVDAAARTASLPQRLMWAFVSPDRLGEAVARDPKWLGALLASLVVGAATVSVVPPEVFVEAWRQAALERGQEFPEAMSSVSGWLRVALVLGALVSTVAMTFLAAVFYSVVFSFVLADEGRFKQYLAAVAHSWFIAAVLGLALSPLWISTGDLELRLNAASFFFFLPDGYVLNVLRSVDLTHIWSTLVFARVVHAIDMRRSFGSAAAISLSALLAFAMIVAVFM